LASAIAGRISPRIVRANRSTASRALGGVDVRVGVVGGDDVDTVDHRLPDVGVQIEGDGDRHFWPDEVAHTPHDLGLGVGKSFGHHRPVQREHDAVRWQCRGDPLAQLAGEGLERLAVGYAGRDAIGEEGRRQLDAALAAGVDDSTQRVVASGE
jgi:hypothetical protein